MKSKVIQILSHNGYLYALCEDGSIWQRFYSTTKKDSWRKIDTE